MWPIDLPADLGQGLWLLACVLSLGLGLWLGLRRAAARVSLRSKGRNARAQEGERKAEELLEAHGYRIVERQVVRTWVMEVDGEEIEVEVRADLLVERMGRQFVAEVKTGERAPDPSFRGTRRQLLEYQLVFRKRVLLIDMEAGEIRKVKFAARRRRSP